jgi:ferritin-like metal-binding protein YciE
MIKIDKIAKVNTNINNSNSQSQSQSMALNIFIEAIKDDLTGRQIKELKQIVENENGDIEKTRPKIVNKLLSFGKDVASNIVANLLTNPSIWSGL